MRLLRLLVLALSLALLLAACGGGEGEDTTTTSGLESTSTTDPSDGTTSAAADDQGEAPELVGEYMVTHYYSPEFNGTTNLWPDSEITLVLGADGTISGNAGCNDYSGTYETSGPYITEPGFDEERGQSFIISGLTWTEMACEDELLMEQEAEYLESLQKVGHWLIGEGFGGADEALLLRSLDEGLKVQAVAGG